MTTSKIKDHSSKKNVSLGRGNLHKNNKDTNVKDFSLVQNGSTRLPNTSAFPMKRFKGTKSHLEDFRTSDTSLKHGRKRKPEADSVDEQYLKKEKQSKCDPLKVLSKLEKFSDVWNDCPIVENPKSGFEIVQNHENELKKFIKDTHFEKKSKSTKLFETLELHNSTNNEKAKDINKSIQRANKKKDNETYERNSGNGVRKNMMNECKEKVSGVGIEDLANNRRLENYELAEMKRQKAVQEQNQLNAEKKTIIQRALSSKVSNQQINKKIVFSDTEDNQESNARVSLKVNQTKSKKLFEDDDSSDGDFELKVNSQFDGKKGQKLLELQSKFASDSRFNLDPRFQDSESEDETLAGNVDFQEEKKRQLEILESIVKQPIRPLSETKKAISKRYDELMVRFDPTKEDHQKYILESQKSSEVKDQSKERVKKSKKDNNSVSNIEEKKPQVSSEKMYAVKDDLKDVLKKENKTEFSLLKLFGSKDDDLTTQQEGSESMKQLKYATKNPFRYDSSESESEGEESKIIEEPDKDKLVKPILSSWRTTFFFSDNDSRFKEAEEFLKVPEDEEDDQEFAEKRKLLKDFIRHKVKNSNRKKDPFKKKLGSVVKKKVFNNNKNKRK